MAENSLACVFDGAGRPLDIQSFPLPDLASGEALVRVTCCTLCSSDLHTYQGRRPAPTPTILGHEILGEIVALGLGEPLLDLDGHPLDVGQRVTWSIGASCGACYFCRHGIPQKCDHLFKYGHEKIRPDHPLSGGLAQFCHLAPGTAIIPLPEILSDEVACPVNCATATVAAGFRVGGGCKDATVLIQGVGMLGITACAMARWYGARQVIACDIEEKRLAMAQRFGATHCVTDQQLKAAVADATSGRGVDLALELSGATFAMQAGLGLLRIGGSYVLIGAVYPGPPISLSPESVIRRLTNIHGIHNYTPTDLAQAVKFLVETHNQFPFAELVAQQFPLEEAETAFQRATQTHAFRIAVKP